MQKQLLILPFVLVFIIAHAQKNIDVLHYSYEINLNDKNDSLQGEATITSAIKDKASTIGLDLQGLKDGKGMIVTDVSLRTVGWAVWLMIEYSHKNNKLVAFLPNGHRGKSDTITIRIGYKGIPDDGLIISKNKYGDKTFFADNWPDRAHRWIPCIDNPDDKATFEFIVTAPSHYSVISNGTKTEEKEIGHGKKLTHWKEETALSTKIMVIGVAKFAIKTFGDSPAGTPVSAWVYLQDSTQGFRNYSPAPSILKFLSGYIGPYPYEKLANVQSRTIFGGMENASAIFYYEESATSGMTLETLLAHEIAHQWFGDMASEKSFPHLWLSEGFATYLTHIYIESKYGTDSLTAEMKEDRNRVIDFAKESDRPVVDFITPYKDLINVNSYQKGGWILHMLRRQLGDSVFHKIIRSYYSAYAGKNADTRDFQKICEQGSGKDLNVFFNQWLYAPGLPKLEVQWKYDSVNKTVLLVIKQLQKNLFQFPLEIQVQSASGKSQWETLSVTKQNQPFSIPVKEKPTQVYLDPKTSLLFEGSVLKVN